MRNPTTGEVDCASGRINAHVRAWQPAEPKPAPAPVDPRIVMLRQFERVVRLREGGKYGQATWADIAAIMGMNITAQEMRDTASAWGKLLGLVRPWVTDDWKQLGMERPWRAKR